MFIAEKHGNVWMVVRRNSEGIVGTIKSFARQSSAVAVGGGPKAVGMSVIAPSLGPVRAMRQVHAGSRLAP